MKKRPLKGTREANTMMALVFVTTIHLISPQARAVDLTIDSGTTTISTDTTYGITKIDGTAGQSATLEVTSGTLTNTGAFYVGFNGTGTLNLTGGNLTTGGAGYIGSNNGSNGTATVSGGTWTLSGNLAVGSNGAIGTLTIGDGGTVIANRQISRNNNSTINLNAGGTLQWNGALGGSFLSNNGALTNNGTLIFNHTGSTRHSGVLSGTGRLINQNSGTLTLSGDNTYTGGTTISAGTLSVGFGFTGGSIAGDVTNNGTLAFNRSNDLTYAGIVSGTGAVTQSGTGTLTLSGTNTYTGATTVTAGLLTVNGDCSSSALTTVGDGAILGGSGTVGALVVESGATIAPGNSPGTLTVDGNVTWQAGGNYNWQLVDALGTAGTGWDTLAISGELDLTALSSANPFNLNLWSLSSAEATAGEAQNFQSGGNFSWTIATASGGITGFDAGDFSIHTGAINGTNGFTNDLTGGTFSLAVVAGNKLNLVYQQLSAVPEPSSHLALLVLGSAGLLTRRRLKRKA